jgi:hypothetical protein
MVLRLAEVEACCCLRKAKGLGPLSIDLIVEAARIGGLFKLTASVHQVGAVIKTVQRPWVLVRFIVDPDGE